jgi:transposase-like protein
LSDKDLKQARALLSDPEITVEDIARRFGLGPSTLYRYLRGGSGFSDGGVSGVLSGQYSNRRADIHEKAKT